VRRRPRHQFVERSPRDIIRITESFAHPRDIIRITESFAHRFT